MSSNNNDKKKFNNGYFFDNVFFYHPTNKRKNRINTNCYWAKIYVNEFASAGCLIPHCPSNRNAKYEYKIRIGTVEITCPIHGCKKIPWQ